mmetsp:Transcript_51232/g.94767  ORF Transcript_51232/g.94767 Transcript_51232/m.94767 type:complete len:100 (+) Transcript_51232:97-396(+)
MQSIKAKLVRTLLSDSILRRVSDSVFDEFDRDQSGYLDQGEIDVAVQRVLVKCHLPAPPGVGHQAMRHFDRDNSGTIDREEFFLVVQKAQELARKSSHY